MPPQDHSGDTRALRVYPATHAKHSIHLTKRPVVKEAALQPRLGDIVLFDSRLQHRGQDPRDANWPRHLSDKIRTVLALSYGRNNLFSDAHERAFKVRTLLVNNASICNGVAERGRCMAAFIQQDLRINPVWCRESPSSPITACATRR